MKKLLSIASLIISLAGRNAHGQAYFLFQSNSKAVWENFTTGEGPSVIAPAGTVNIAFLVGSGTPLIGTSGSPTNVDVFENSPFVWNNLLSDPNFHLATNANTGQTAITTTLGNGAFVYNAASSFPVVGTTPGTTYNVFVIGWESVFGATPQAAAAAGGLVGWSNTFPYTPGIVIDTEPNFTFAGMQPFGLVIPEPSVFSLASLGAMSLAFYRRRK